MTRKRELLFLCCHRRREFSGKKGWGRTGWEKTMAEKSWCLMYTTHLIENYVILFLLLLELFKVSQQTWRFRKHNRIPDASIFTCPWPFRSPFVKLQDSFPRRWGVLCVYGFPETDRIFASSLIQCIYVISAINPNILLPLRWLFGIYALLILLLVKILLWFNSKPDIFWYMLHDWGQILTGCWIALLSASRHLSKYNNFETSENTVATIFSLCLLMDKKQNHEKCWRWIFRQCYPWNMFLVSFQ